MSGVLPEGACDAHCHVFGPQPRFAFAPGRSYTPADAPKEALAALHARLGIDRAVIVQAAAHGFDNSATLDAIAAAPARRRGIALVPEDVAAGTLQSLHAGGMRGVRFNFVPHLGAPPTSAGFRRIAALIAPLGWHVVVHVAAAGLPLLETYLDGLALPLVIDHMARIAADADISQPAFRRLLALSQDPRIWVKLSGADRSSAAGAPYADALPFLQALIGRAPDRVLWGTDWPHPNIKGPMPHEEDLLALLRLAAADTARLRQILVDNPNRLYRFA
ncbi:MAG: amidohydrolase family protein [Rhizomicrobium sp.]